MMLLNKLLKFEVYNSLDLQQISLNPKIGNKIALIWWKMQKIK